MHIRKNRLNWDDLKFFLTLAENRTITESAQILGVNYVTVSRRIDRLENSLNEKLFERRSDGYFLTSSGDMLKQNGLSVRNSFERIEENFFQRGNQVKTIKLSMVHSLASCLVTTNFAKLMRNHPYLNLDIDTSTRNASIIRREVDIALRLDLPESGESISRKLGEITFILCGTSDLTDKFNNGQNVPIICYNNELNHTPESKFMKSHLKRMQVALQTNSLTVQKTAAMNGIGLALLPDYLFHGSNLHPIPMDTPVKREVWLLVKKNIALNQNL